MQRRERCLPGKCKNYYFIDKNIVEPESVIRKKRKKFRRKYFTVNNVWQFIERQKDIVAFAADLLTLILLKSSARFLFQKADRMSLRIYSGP